MKNFIIFVVVAIILFFSAQEFVPYFAEAYQEAVLFKSVDQGRTWQELFKAPGLDILSLAINPENSNHIFLGTQKGLYRSYSKGRFWHHINQADLSGRAEIQDIIIDQSNPDQIYLAVYQDRKAKLIRSQDNGLSWRQIYVGLKKKDRISSIALDSYQPSILYLATSQGALLKSSNYGMDWRLLDWFDDEIAQLAVNPQDTRVVYLVLEDGRLYQSFDKGESWQLLADLSKQFRKLGKVTKLSLNPQEPSRLYLGSEYGLFSSLDSGRTWRKMDLVMPAKVRPALALAASAENLFYGAGSIVYNTKDGGKHWQVSEAAGGREVSVIAFDRQNPSLVYFGTKD